MSTSRRQPTGKGVGCAVLAPGKALVRSPMGGWEVVPAEPRIATERRKRSENGKHKKIKDASRAMVAVSTYRTTLLLPDDAGNGGRQRGKAPLPGANAAARGRRSHSSTFRKYLAALAVVLAATTAARAEFVPVTDSVTIVDGDTIRLGREKVRLKGPDAPESYKSRCAAEMAVAHQATERLRQLLAIGPITIERHGLDRYGRTLANVRIGDGRDVGDVLIAEGLAVAWRPGRIAWAERAHHWCGPEWSEQ